MNSTQDNQTGSIYYPPGGILIWIVIFLELLTFGAVLLAMAVYAKDESSLFHQSRLQLNVIFGTLNTFFLLTSGYCMAQVISKLKVQDYKASQRFMNGAIIGGLLFLILKSVEYAQKIDAGLTMGTNTFWSFYWMLTLFHVVHVIVGLVILIVQQRSIVKHISDTLLEDVSAGAAFWHMCDLIWLLLFPVLYLVF